ncbi:hypothetical protein LINGRAHAP2_LOCUS7584 [Linum grandiflorum]
MFPIT